MPPLTERLFVDDMGSWFRLFAGDPGIGSRDADLPPCVTLSDVDSLVLLKFLDERKEEIQNSILGEVMEKAGRRAGAQ